ncbi:helix-turn-helix domain-containing protein [Kutzneria buriramensis]|uniref:Transcriptional regulator with XRE-family HTH domain n=1 Tax=Kutzneria buriramensis TaxID=1045776 RepID=A0A3E0G5P3_9PSEU|nr:helix-turn-helix transcriptional regulator [Kutzneria buriramensis]REH18259.1 transcriptional regulator with XRE-family HTH domain [Kutzneria buriramensis]
MASEPEGLSARLEWKRKRSGFERRSDLAVKAGISVHTIESIEQGRRIPTIPVLQRIAAALDTTAAWLLSKPNSLPSTDPTAEGIVAIRRVLQTVDEDLVDALEPVEPLTVAAAQRTADYLWGCYWSGAYEQLARLLPTAIPQVRATVRDVPSSEKAAAAEAHARVVQAAGDTLVHLAQPDLAWMAITESIAAANNGQDALLPAALRISRGWQLLVQGRYRESQAVALAAARTIEPAGEATMSQLTAYGLLTVTAATAAARAEPLGDAKEVLADPDDLLEAAGEIAARVGHERSDHQSTFGPSKVIMLKTDCHVVREHYDDALVAAAALPREAPLPLATRARHLADVALCQSQTGQEDQALTTLLTVEQMAPAWIPYQSLPRQVVGALVDQQRRVDKPLLELAGRLGVEV